MASVLRAETGVGVVADILITPSYKAIQQHCRGDIQGTTLKSPASHSIAPLAGARAIAAYRVTGEKQPYFTPSIVLPDGRVGVLHTVADAKRDIKEAGLFSDFQQLLLAGIYASQQEGVGSLHTRGIAELGHASLIAVSRQPSSIHETTHQFADSKQFATKISALTTVYSGHTARPTNSLVLNAAQVNMLVFLPDNQTPLPANAFEASAGFALAATKTQPSPFNIQANAGAMAAQMGV
jgi:hypothetical protein